MSDSRFDLAHFELFGHAPTDVFAPATADEARQCLQQHRDTALFIWGGGTRKHIGYAPARNGVALSTENLFGITDYHPADLVATAQAGTTVAALQEALAEHGKWLPLAVARPGTQTLGGVVAARAHSLLRLGFGSVRDALLGVQVVNAGGELIQGGGRVMKNVSGYDLPKLYCGSWGTLGLMTSVTFKVAPLPEASATAVLPLAEDRNSEEILDALLAGPLSPSFVMLLSAQAAADILQTTHDAQHLVLGFDGLADDVAWQVETLGAGDGLLPPERAQTVRNNLRDFSLQDAPMTCAFHILSSQVGAYSRMMEWTARRAGLTARVVSDAALGIVQAHFSPTESECDWHAFHADLSDKAARVGGSFIVERMPEELRCAGVDVWSPVLSDVEVMRRVKQSLDPRGQWNPGRFFARL